MYVEASYYNEGSKGRLLSPLMWGPTHYDGGEMCIRFWYHMYGASCGTLNLYVKRPDDMDLGDPKWTRIGNRGDLWRGGEYRATISDFDELIEQDFIVCENMSFQLTLFR